MFNNKYKTKLEERRKDLRLERDYLLSFTCLKEQTERKKLVHQEIKIINNLLKL